MKEKEKEWGWGWTSSLKERMTVCCDSKQEEFNDAISEITWLKNKKLIKI